MKAFADQMKTSHTLATSAALWNKTRYCQHAEDLAKVQDILNSACLGPSMLERGCYLHANAFSESALHTCYPPPSRRLSFNEDVHLIPECYAEWRSKPLSQTTTTTTTHGLSKYDSSVPPEKQMQWAMDLSQTQRLLIILRDLLQSSSSSSLKPGDGNDNGNSDDTESLVTLAGEIDGDVSEGHKVGKACLELLSAAVSFKKFKVCMYVCVLVPALVLLSLCFQPVDGLAFCRHSLWSLKTFVTSLLLVWTRSCRSWRTWWTSFTRRRVNSSTNSA